jgi:hypothetical protein
MLLRILKQPLLHFLILGALIFVAYEFAAEPEPEEEGVSNLIVVDRAALLTYMQYRAQAFEPELFAAELDAMNTEELGALTAAFVREEALYREALRMGLERGDYNIRQRLVQKVEFLLENLLAGQIEPTDAELQAFFDARSEDYRVASAYTFTHIFFDGQQDTDGARSRAMALLGNSGSISFEQASQHGDRYPFLQNYVDRTRDFVANNFGADFVSTLDTFTPGELWQGPVQSRYGWHLVLLRARSEPRQPQLAELRERVLDDFRYEAITRAREQAETRVVDAYRVAVEL